MNRIDRYFQEREEGPLFIPYLTCGLPNLTVTKRLLHVMKEEGTKLVELGVPYSDPLADGPVIQEASQKALQQGVTLESCLNLAQEARGEGIEAGFILFSYYNPLFQYGLERLFSRLQSIGVDGIIIPDLPFEESEKARRLGRAHDVRVIPLAAPTSQHRLQMIAQQAQGMVYCVSSLGVTGMRQEFHRNLFAMVEEVKKWSQLPAAVGFGVSSREQFLELGRFADGVVVGSAIVKKLLELAEDLASGQIDRRSRAETELRDVLRQFT